MSLSEVCPRLENALNLCIDAPVLLPQGPAGPPGTTGPLGEIGPSVS